MKKILFIIGSLKGGGAEKQVVSDANALLHHGYDITIIYAHDGELKNSLHNNIKTIKLDRKWYAVYRIYKILHNNHYSIIFCHSQWSYNRIFIPALLTKHKWVMFIHGLNLWRRGINLIFFRVLSTLVDKVVITSEASRKRRIEVEKINPEKIIKIYNSYTYSQITGNEISENSLSKYFVIGCVSRFENIKQLHLFVDICQYILNENIDKIKIILVGKGKIFNEIKSLVNNRGLKDYFEIPGYVENIHYYYNIFNVMVLPSKHEDLSVALLEASSYGLPCIAFNVGGNDEIIINGKTGWLIKPYDINEMARKILMMEANRELSKEMRKNARKRVIKYFSQDSRTDKLCRLIEHYG